MKALMLLALAGLSISTAHAADTTLTLACKGTQTAHGDAGTTSEPINIGVIVDFQKKAVLGVSGDSESVPITSTSETTISFAAQETGWVGQHNGCFEKATG